jgi:hypothetical protein
MEQCYDKPCQGRKEAKDSPENESVFTPDFNAKDPYEFIELCHSLRKPLLGNGYFRIRISPRIDNPNYIFE